MSIMVGMGSGASAGVLVRNAEALERMERIDTLVLDKTGTLTEGKPKVTGLRAIGAVSEAELLCVAASLERASEHPLAAAVMRAAEERGIALAPIGAFRAETGKGITGAIADKDVAIGNLALFRSLGIDADALAAEAEARRANAETVMFVAIGGAAAGFIAVADPIKANAAQALARLRAAGLRIVMLSGDNGATAIAVGRKLGIEHIVAELLPAEKAAQIKKLQGEGRIVAMAGDGINDAPALAQADIGIAMGTGTDIALETAGITLLKGDLTGLVRALALSRATMRNIRENLFFAFVFNALAVPIAAGVLYPLWGVLLNPMIASAAMSLSSVTVIGNALRLRTIRL
jgi:Cu+-exporting ATPase